MRLTQMALLVHVDVAFVLVLAQAAFPCFRLSSSSSSSGFKVVAFGKIAPLELSSQTLMERTTDCPITHVATAQVMTFINVCRK